MLLAVDDDVTDEAARPGFDIAAETHAGRTALLRQSRPAVTFRNLLEFESSKQQRTWKPRSLFSCQSTFSGCAAKRLPAAERKKNPILRDPTFSGSTPESVVVKTRNRPLFRPLFLLLIPSAPRQ